LAEVSKAVRLLERELGRAPEDHEIAKALGMELEAYHKLSEDLAKGPALARLGEMSPDDVAAEEGDASHQMSERQQKERLVAAIKQLPERTQMVLALYYQEECTQAEIGEILGITESRVCQILGESSARLRAKLTKDA
jgi:RNA polymerase sigma factor for flagellar operon FliA